MTDYRDKIEVDLKDLIRYIFGHWKLILVGVLVGSVIGVIYGHFSAAEQQKKEDLLTPNAYRGEISEKEAREVELLYNAYKEYQILYSEINSSDNVDFQDRFELIESANQLLLAQNVLSANAKTYYNSLMLEDNIDQSKDAITDSESGSTSLGNSIRYILLGAIICSFLVAGWYALKYVISSTVKTADDIRTMFDLPIIGNVSSGNTQNIPLVSATILGSARKNNVNRVFLFGSVEDESYKNVSDGIREDIKDEYGVSIAGMRDLTELTLTKSIADDAVVLIERLKVSKYENVARELELCYNYGIKILGVVIIE